jgi:hypothetical protein
MGHPNISHYGRIFLEVSIVESPVMGEVGADKDYVAGFKLFDTIANELSAFAFLKMDQFDFGVIMPAVIDIWYQVLAYTEGIKRFF